MEHFSPEHRKSPPEKPAAEAIAEEQFEEALKATKVVEDDFSVERAKLLRAQEQIEARVEKSRFQARSLGEAKQIVHSPETLIILQRMKKKDRENLKIKLKIELLRSLKEVTMNKLKKRLRDIDAHIDYPEEEKARRRAVFYDEENKHLFVNENGEKKQITFGDIVADMDWGILYRPDELLPREMWRKIRKLSDLSEARQSIFHIFNQEIDIFEETGLPITSRDEEYLKKHFSDNDNNINGIVGELVAKSILVRTSYKNLEVQFKVEPANAIEDTQLKYDFKVWIPQKTLGVALEGENVPREEFVKNKMRVGIQFTVSTSPLYLNRKRRAIKTALQKISEEKFNRYIKRKVDDIVLVSVPLTTYKDSFKQWLLKGKPSGGPEQFLSDEDKNQLVNKVLAALQ